MRLRFAALLLMPLLAGCVSASALVSPSADPTPTGADSPAVAVRSIPVALPSPSTLPSPSPGASASPHPVSSPYPTYPDGIPSEIDGAKVYRPAALPVPTDSTPFLIGGWSVAYEGESCPSQAGTTMVLDGCLQGWAINDRQDLTGAVVWPLIPLTNVPMPATMGIPLVVRVHTHDPLAARCAAETRPACDARIILDAVVWTR